VKHGFLLFVTILTVIMLITACGPLRDKYVNGARDHYDEELDTELDNIVNGIVHLDTTDEIKLFALYSDQFCICIDLYGSDKLGDMVKIGHYLNRYLEINSSSRLINDKLKICIQLFKNEPTRKDREKLWYFASLANFDQICNPGVSEWNHSFVYLDINIADDLKTSSFENCDIPFESIWLPTNTTIDDYEVFVSMEHLRSLVFDDPVLHENSIDSEKKKEEIKYFDKYKDLKFSYKVY